MAVVVAYKWASNPQDASVGPDGTVDWTRAKPSISEYDPVAIAFGRQVADAAGAELVGVSVGVAAVGAAMAKKSAMSRGLDRGVVVADDEVRGWNATQTSEALAALVGRVEGADLVITGEASIDESAKMTSALLAGYLGWPCFQGVSAATQIDGGWKLTQTVPGGTREIEVSGPVVIAATADAVATKVPGMKDILAAGKKVVDVIPAADLGLTRVDAEVVGREAPAKRARKNQLFTGNGAAAELVAALRADGVL